jgi:hypothetical protein
VINHKKKVYAVAPCFQERGSNFKIYPYNAWVNNNGKEVKANYLPKCMRGLAYQFDYPTIIQVSGQCRLRFVEACTIGFDCFPDYICYETIPIIWDCWPRYLDDVVSWIRKHKVKSAVFTASQTAELTKKLLPNLNVLVITEGIDSAPYHPGENLIDRDIDLLEYGRVERNFFREYIDGLKHVNAKNSNGRMSTWDKLIKTISQSKVCVALPRCDVDKEFTGGIETLTQRFWEGMLSRCVLLGRAPKELIDLIGYNPVINLDKTNPQQQVRNIVAHIEDYQHLVNRNRETALKMGSWDIRMKQVMEWLRELGYEV